MPARWYAIWENPEFIRHFRMQVREARAFYVILSSVAICGLFGAVIFTQRDPVQGYEEAAKTLFGGIYVLQFLVLVLGFGYYCGNAISRERELKTFDFLRTTSLSPHEFTWGMLLGCPLIALLAVAAALPISLASGLVGGVSPIQLVESYVLMAVTAMFTGLAGLACSMFAKRGGAAMIVVLLFGPWTTGLTFVSSDVPGFAALSPIAAMDAIFHWKMSESNLGSFPVFNFPVPVLLISLFLYATLGAWIYLLLVRNIKRNISEVHVLTRPQALGFTIYVNVLFWAFSTARTTNMTAGYALLNMVLMYVSGLTMLTPVEELRVWGRTHRDIESYLSESSPSWPWTLAVLMAAVVLMFGLGHAKPESLVPMAICGLFAVRDLIFFQYCVLTRMKRPIAAGFAGLFLYYATLAVLGLAFQMNPKFFYGLSFFAILGVSPPLVIEPFAWIGFAFQLAFIFILLVGIQQQLALRPKPAPAA